MFARLALLFRLLILLVAVPTAISPPYFCSVAMADDDDDDGDDDDDDDDDDGGGDDDDDDDAKAQPKVTAGGMYTKKTYPVTELERTLQVIGGMFEARAGIDIDVGDQTAFDIWRLRVDARYGLQDNVELQAGGVATLAGDVGAGNLAASFFVGIEGALSFDVVNVRLATEITAKRNLMDVNLLDIGFDIIGGVPFRYRFSPKVAIIALDKILTVHTAGGKPDLTIGVGFIFQALANLALVARGEVTVIEFNTKNIVVPATAAVQFSPNNQFDIGAEFSFTDVKVDEGEMREFYDNRSLLLFGQTRF